MIGSFAFRIIQMDMRKGKVSYQVELLECEHECASEGQHVRKALFTESGTDCQGKS
jgi:hypothetical protein